MPKNDAVVVVDPFKRALRSIYTGVTVTVPSKSPSKFNILSTVMDTLMGKMNQLMKHYEDFTVHSWCGRPVMTSSQTTLSQVITMKYYKSFSRGNIREIQLLAVKGWGS